MNNPMKFRTYFIPRISLSSHIVVLVFALVIGLVAIGLGVHKSVLKESLVGSGFVFLALAVYYFVMLYRGVRYDNGVVRWSWKGVSWRETCESIAESGVNLGQIPTPDFDFGDDLIGGILAFLLGILVAIVLILLVIGLAWLGVNLLGFTMFVIWVPLYFLLRQGLRMALVNVRYCQGQALHALWIAVVHAAIGAIAVGVVFFLTEWLIRRLFG